MAVLNAIIKFHYILIAFKSYPTMLNGTGKGVFTSNLLLNIKGELQICLMVGL